MGQQALFDTNQRVSSSMAHRQLSVGYILVTWARCLECSRHRTVYGPFIHEPHPRELLDVPAQGVLTGRPDVLYRSSSLTNLKVLGIDPKNFPGSATFYPMLALPGPRTIASFIRVNTFTFLIGFEATWTDQEGSDDSDMSLVGICSISARFSDLNAPFSLVLSAVHARIFRVFSAYFRMAQWPPS